MRLIGPNGEQLGVQPTQRALAHAQELGYDLVEIAPNAVPPVAKILDFGKYRFEKQQEAKEAKKRQKSVTWKEIRVTPKIDDHDIETKVKSASKFLADGDKLKLTVRFRGRELAHPDRGRVLLMQIAERLKEHGSVERTPLLEGRSKSMVMNPLRGAGAPPAPGQMPPQQPPPGPGMRPAPGLPRTPAASAAAPQPSALPARPPVAAPTAPESGPTPVAPRPAAPSATASPTTTAAPRTTTTRPAAARPPQRSA